MFKKIATLFLLLIFVINSAGCSGTWRKKFVRKKDAETKEGPVLQPLDYSKEFTNKQLYANHYAFWRTSEAELINSIKPRNRNNKKIRLNASYSLLELKKLYDLLIDEKQKDLKPYVDELESIVAKIKESNYANSNSNYLIRVITKHYRNVSRDFSYFDMKNYCRPDEVDVLEEEIIEKIPESNDTEINTGEEDLEKEEMVGEEHSDGEQPD